jgi:hypothetical protein
MVHLIEYHEREFAHENYFLLEQVKEEPSSEHKHLVRSELVRPIEDINLTAIPANAKLRLLFEHTCLLKN